MSDSNTNSNSSKISNILKNITKNEDSKRSETNNIEKCKKILMSKPLMAMFSIKDIVAGSVGTVVPWCILLIIVAIIIVV
jgi:lipopolysaccharide/colanic/teichoic acid biosynthesis glycosyltransferase